MGTEFDYASKVFDGSGDYISTPADDYDISKGWIMCAHYTMDGKVMKIGETYHHNVGETCPVCSPADLQKSDI